MEADDFLRLIDGRGLDPLVNHDGNSLSGSFVAPCVLGGRASNESHGTHMGNGGRVDVYLNAKKSQLTRVPRNKKYTLRKLLDLSR